MASVTAKYRSTGLKFNGEFTKTLDKGIKSLVRLAARAWLKEVVKIVRIWSGETMGSLKFAQGPNGNLARYLNLAIPINAPHPRNDKNETTGGKQGHYNFSSARHVYSFFYRSDVPQFFENEYKTSVSPTSPWHALVAGRIAFDRYIDANLDKLKPKLKNLVIREVKTTSFSG